MIFVTMFCPLTTTGARETLVQTIGATRFVVDCKVNPGLLVGHAISKLAAVPEPEVMAVGTSTGAELDTTGGPTTSVGENTPVLSPAVS